MLFSHDMSDVVQRAALGSKQGPLSLTDKVCADLSHSDGARRTREETRAVRSSAFVVWDSVALRLSPNLPLQLLAAYSYSSSSCYYYSYSYYSYSYYCYHYYYYYYHYHYHLYVTTNY